MATEFYRDINIDTDLWVEILRNRVVMPDSHKMYLVMKILLNSPGYESSAGDIIAPALEYTAHISVNNLVAHFSKRILQQYPFVEVPVDKGEKVYWHVPFLERIVGNNNRNWILRPELAKALSIAYPEILDKKNLSIGIDEAKLQQVVHDDFVSIENESHSFKETDRDAFVRQRIGQSKFREYLSSYWQGCSVTGCEQIEVLIASHIKPWSESDSDERLDKFNGLLLTPNLDKCFDNYLISFKNDRSIIISDKLTDYTRSLFGITPDLSLQCLAPQHVKYLSHHRDKFYSTQH